MLERSQFLDANLESAKIMTVLASLLGESGALKRADTLLRQALELFWRELKDPTPAVARCYRVSGWPRALCWLVSQVCSCVAEAVWQGRVSPSGFLLCSNGISGQQAFVAVMDSSQSSFVL